MNAATESVVERKPASAAGAWICLLLAWILFLVPFPGLGLFVGWPLNLVAFILAIVVMSRGQTAKGLLPLIASIVVSPIVYFVGLAIFAVAVDEAANSVETSTASPVAQEARRADAVTVSASELANAYASNEIAADSRFKGKFLRVSGTVESIDSDFSDEPVIQLATSDMFVSVSARGLPISVASTISQGQRLELSCVGGGEVLGSPMLDDCQIAE